jgi:hypothetical protein
MNISPHYPTQDHLARDLHPDHPAGLDVGVQPLHTEDSGALRTASIPYQNKHYSILNLNAGWRRCSGRRAAGAGLFCQSLLSRGVCSLVGWLVKGARGWQILRPYGWNTL